MTHVHARGAHAGVVAKLALLSGFALALAGCSTVGGWFSGKSNGEVKPAELTDFTATATATRLWSTGVGKGEGRLGARQGPAVANGRVYAAAQEGGVSAYDLQTGAAAWHFASDLPLAGTPGVGDDLVAVGSLEGDIVALDAATGAQKWTAKVGTEVLAAPAIGQGLVLVRSIDGRVTAFDAATGERRWFWEKETPSLTVRGNAAPVLVPGLALIANDDGTLTALSLGSGSQLWEQIIAAAEGRSELERMADVDGTPTIDGTTVFATSYKKQTMAIDGPSGRPLWAHDAGGPGRAGVSADRVVVSDPQGTVWGLDKSSGSGLWQQPALARRGLTGVAIQGDYAVVGDYEGYLHWLRLTDGALAARARATGDAIRAVPVVADGVLVVQGTNGELSAWRVAP